MSRCVHYQIIAMLAFGSAVAQQQGSSDGNPTLEELEKLTQKKNVASHLQSNVNQTVAVLTFFHMERGKWPGSWEELDSHFETSIWESPKVRETFTRSFVLLPGVQGSLKQRDGHGLNAALMMVMTAPTERLFHSSGKTELGRWAVWRNAGGRFIEMWHPEAEITSFSAWPQVQERIDLYVRSLRTANPRGHPGHPPGSHTGLREPPGSCENAAVHDRSSSGAIRAWITAAAATLLLIAVIAWWKASRKHGPGA